MARFSRLPSARAGRRARRRADARERDGPAGRRPVHLLPVLMSVEETPSSRGITADTRMRRPRVTEVDGRRLSSAGHALVVAVLALVIGLLLDAPGLHKTAFNEPPGTQRTVALAITGAARDHEPRALPRPAALLAEVGARHRSGDDTIDTRVALPPPPTQTIAPALGDRRSGPRTSRGTGKAFTPTHPLRLWVAGDSLVIDPGYALQRAALASPRDQERRRVDGRIGDRARPARRVQLVPRDPPRAEGAAPERRRALRSAATTTRGT